MFVLILNCGRGRPFRWKNVNLILLKCTNFRPRGALRKLHFLNLNATILSTQIAVAGQFIWRS